MTTHVQCWTAWSLLTYTYKHNEAGHKAWKSVLTKDIHHLVPTVVAFQIKGVCFPGSFEKQVVVLTFHHREVSLFINGNSNCPISLFCRTLLKSSQKCPNLLKFLLLKIAMRKVTSQGQNSLQRLLRMRHPDS